jgi:hypothetical protein
MKTNRRDDVITLLRLSASCVQDAVTFILFPNLIVLVLKNSEYEGSYYVAEAYIGFEGRSGGESNMMPT